MEAFRSVLELTQAVWSGNNRSGILFLLNLAKLIDSGFGVETSTIKRIQVTVIRRPRLQQGERVRGEITSSKGQEVITSSKGKTQETRNKKPGSNKKKNKKTKKTKKKKRRRKEEEEEEEEEEDEEEEEEEEEQEEEMKTAIWIGASFLPAARCKK